MEDNFWQKLNRKFEQIHLKDTEIKTSGESVYINPTVKFAIAWGIFLVLLLLFILIGKPFAKKDGDNTSGGIGKAGTSDSIEQSSNEDYIPFEHNEHPDVNAFVESYLNALTSCDINMLNSMVADASEFNIDKLTRRQEYIVKESNPECYTKPGVTEGSYVVYVVVNSQIKGVSVQPLSLYFFYLVPNENGGYIFNNIYNTDPDIDAYMNKIERDPDVVELYARVNKNNDESVKNDESLRQFYESINVDVK